MASSVCINHTSRPATARCITCHKPVCEDCVVRHEGSTFCSGACRDNYSHFHARYKGERPQGFFAQLFGSVKNLVITLIGFGLLGLILVYAGAKILNLGFCQDLLKRIGLS
ncbi:MAG: hypothetical protein AMXMBFR7_06440 [Planctomycetota bacterium]